MLLRGMLIVDMQSINHQVPPFHLKIFNVLLQKQKVTYTSDGLKVSKLTATFDFWLNFPFNDCDRVTVIIESKS